MTNPLTVPPPDWVRLRHADEPSLRQQLPGFSTPTESANVLLNKQIATLNRAGSGPGNPILSGLGVTIQYALSRGERITGLFIFQDPGALGISQLPAASLNALLLTYNFRAGSGLTKAGSPLTGAKKNMLRISSATGGTEREYWIKSYDSDIVTLNGEAGLDKTTLLPVPITVQQVTGLVWQDVRVDFMPSWNDEFQVLHASTDADREAGFRKSYGGAAFVSFFDTTPGTEGVGTGVNPITQAFIYETRSIQVDNSPGTYHITARFRSRKDSSYFVDIPLVITVTAAPAGSCLPPVDEPCGKMLLLRGTALPANVQGAPSVPGVQDVLGTPGAILTKDLFWVSLHASIVGSTPTLLVRKWGLAASGQDLSGAKEIQIGSDLEYLPLVQPATSPVPGAPYQPPNMLTLCFDVASEKVLGVAWYTVSVKDGHSLSPAQLFAGPQARSIALMPAGGLGGTDPCVIY